MARINIEDELFRDNRFMDLVIALKSPETALGALVSCWIVAQEHWKTSDEGIPKKVWLKQKLRKELIEVGFAEDRGDHIYVVGSAKHFAWLRQRVESGRAGGKKTVKNRARRAAIATAELNQTQASLSLSSSPSPSVSDSESKTGAVLYNADDSAGSEIKNPIGFFIANYVNAYQHRYGPKARPPLAGKVQGQIRTFLKDTPLARACELIQTYMQMNDAWFLNKAHDFATFSSNVGKVALKLDTGHALTGGKAREVERAHDNADTWERAATLVNQKLGARDAKP